MTTPILYLIAAPIGNLGDLSPRARECLAEVGLIAAEDTRVARRLVTACGLVGSSGGKGKEYLSVRAHNENRAAAALIGKIRAHGSAAYLSDAGTPAVSDPGARLVRAVRAAGIRTVPVPGPSALTAILSVGGVTADSVHFFGFPPRAAGERRRFFAALPQYAGAVVLFEAPPRVPNAAALLAEHFDEDTRIVIGRELTKQHEQIAELTLAELASAIANEEIPLRGEFVLLIESSGKTAAPAAASKLFDALVRELPPAKAAKLAAKLGGGDADALYKMHVARGGKNLKEKKSGKNGKKKS